MGQAGLVVGKWIVITSAWYPSSVLLNLQAQDPSSHMIVARGNVLGKCCQMSFIKFLLFTLE